jgi:hypothetical protein
MRYKKLMKLMEINYILFAIYRNVNMKKNKCRSWKRETKYANLSNERNNNEINIIVQPM